MMSFTYDIKQELARFETKKACCLRAECYGVWLFSKCFTIFESAFISESHELVSKMAELAATVCGVMPKVSYSVKKRGAYHVSLPDERDRIALLESFGHTGRELVLRINYANIENDCCYAAFLRGAFLACGMITDPQSGYNMEYLSQNRPLTKDLMDLLNGLDDISMRAQTGNRKGSCYVYLKESEQCEELLTYIGAFGGAMKLMQVKMYKEAKNNINRVSNFETANMDKTYSASARQIAAIARISDAGKLSELPAEQQAIAVMRLENPEMSLRELSEQLNHSRSGINYRMKKIMEFAENLPFPDTL